MDVNRYDIIVIGAGHAGIEASYAAAKMGCKTALITISLKTIGRPSCNPSIGGTAKGHLVKELDSLGGVMGILADKAGIQFKMLNRSKGPAVWSPRCQIDKDLYPLYAYDLLSKTENLTLLESTVAEILIENDSVKGIRTLGNEIIYSRAIVFCAGTFLNGLMHVGDKSISGGRYGEAASKYISDLLNRYGFEMGRLKTGTPPRLARESIDFASIAPAYGDEEPEPFSRKTHQVKNRIICWLTQTSEVTHNILREGFSRSPMFTGIIKGVGPRYCPSVEDKVARFSDKPSHKILLEPEGLSTNSIYVNGFSTSLPEDIQERGIKSIKGLEKAEIIRYGYAIEYDFFFPYQLKYTLETKLVSGLFFAGQINGTSGYEEAAVQGFVAGVNAALKIKNEGEFFLNRAEAYIGVLIDDLVNKNTEEPYRIFTSLAEYRLLLRQDNADLRLMHYGHSLGLISDEEFEKLLEKKEKIKKLDDYVKSVKLRADEINNYLKQVNESPVVDSLDLYQLTKRSNVQLSDLLKMTNSFTADIKSALLDPALIEHLQAEIKYEGYIARQMREVENFRDNEGRRIPDNFDYDRVSSISNEAREKLKKIKPASLGQASRISGVSASDVAILSVFLK